MSGTAKTVAHCYDEGAGIKCPVCDGNRHRTVNTRPGEPSTTNTATKDLNHHWRRKHCLGCGFVFTTYEIAADDLKSLVAAQRIIQSVKESSHDH